MKVVRTSILATALLSFAAIAQASDPFYTALLTRGIADAQRGDNFRAAKELRIAAFGLVDEPQQYLRAQVYLAKTCERLNEADDAQTAVEKASMAEQILPSYATAAIDPETRGAFEALAKKILRAEQLALVPAFTHRVTPGPKPAPAISPLPPQVQAVVEKPAPAPTPVVQKPAPAPAPTPVAQKPTPAPAPAPVVVQKPTPAPVVVQKPAPAPVVVERKPAPPVVVPKPAPPQPQPQPVATKPAPSPAPQPTSPLVAASRHQPSQSPAAMETSIQIAEAQRYLNEGKILAARQLFLRLGQSSSLSRATLLEVAKGLNQTSAFRESSSTYQKAMPFQSGEEMHEFYEAVNRYELGDVASARDLIASALPALPVTRETSLYRAKILGVQ